MPCACPSCGALIKNSSASAPSGWACLHPHTSSEQAGITLVIFFNFFAEHFVAASIRVLCCAAKRVALRGSRCCDAVQSLSRSGAATCRGLGQPLAPLHPKTPRFEPSFSCISSPQIPKRPTQKSVLPGRRFDGCWIFRGAEIPPHQSRRKRRNLCVGFSPAKHPPVAVVRKDGGGSNRLFDIKCR
jgi:hypothetical protein